MALPTPNQAPPFDITRASHVVLDVSDLAESRRFYEDLVGLVVTAARPDALYLRGVEEACHHSVVLRRAAEPGCRRIGFRVRRDADLHVAKRWFERRGLQARFVDRPFQGRTLHVTDVAGTPLELVARMPTVPRAISTFDTFKGAAPAGLDHHVVELADVGALNRMYAALGFRISEYLTLDGTPDTPLVGAFMGRKGNATDLGILMNEGPRMHHFSCVVRDAASTMMRVCDIAGALDYGSNVESGPARHGAIGTRFVFLRDPDGHRIELTSASYQLIDPEVAPVGWAASDPTAAIAFGAPAPAAWFNDAMRFTGVATAEPDMNRIVARPAPPAHARALER